MAKSGLEWPKLQLFYIYSTLSCLKNIKLTWMHLFFKNKKLRDDLLPKTLKIAIFIREWPKNLLEWLKFLIFSYLSYTIMPNKVPVIWYALIH